MKATDTRNEAYRSDSRETKRQRVFGVIASNEYICDKDISAILGWPINCVTGRRRELVEKGMVEDAGIERIGGRRVHVWRVKTDDEQIRLI